MSLFFLFYSYLLFIWGNGIIAARLGDVQIGKSRSYLLSFRICAIFAQQIGIRARRFVQICASMASRKSGRSGGNYAITHLDGKRDFVQYRVKRRLC